MFILFLITLVFAGFMTWAEEGGYPDGLSFECRAMWVLAVFAGVWSLMLWVV